MASWSCLTITHNVKYLNQMLNNHLIPSLIHFSVITKHPKLYSISLNSYFCFKLRANRGLYCCSQKERQVDNLYQSFLCLSNCSEATPPPEHHFLLVGCPSLLITCFLPYPIIIGHFNRLFSSALSFFIPHIFPPTQGGMGAEQFEQRIRSDWYRILQFIQN